MTTGDGDSGYHLVAAKPEVVTIPQALKALAAMERELEAAETYVAILKMVRAAEALKHLLGQIAEVKQKAEWVVLAAYIRIGEKIKKVPKASGGDQRSNLPRRVNSKSGRAALGMPGTSRARLQKLAGIGVTKAKAMAEELWAAGKDATVKAVLGENRFAEITRMHEQRRAQTAQGGSVANLHALIASGFRAGVIAADPPWPLTHYGERARGGVWGHYETMPLDAIKALPIASLAADDCALFLWCAWPNMPMWHQVIEAWGFRFTSLASDWIKLNPSEGLHGSNGYTTRQNPEPCLLAKRGKPLRLDESVHSVIEAPVGVHSEKPDEAYRRMQRLFGGPYLELFARRPRAGWKTWGKELPPTRESWDEMWKRPFNYSKLNAGAPPDDPWPDLPDFLRRTAP